MKVMVLEEARAAQSAQQDEVGQLERALDDLRRDREQAARAHEDTRDLRAEIAEREGDLGDARAVLRACGERVARLEDMALELERQETLAGIYRGDVRFLAARAAVLAEQARLAQAREVLRHVVGDLSERRVSNGDRLDDPRSYATRVRLRGVDPERRLRLGGATAAAPGFVVPLGDDNGGDTLRQVNGEVERFEALAGEHERLAQEVREALGSAEGVSV